MWANRPHEAIAALQRLDPQRGFARDFFLYWDFLTNQLHSAGRHDEELEQARRGRRQYPTLRPTVASELRALYALGETQALDSLWELFESLPPIPHLEHWRSAGDLHRLAALEARAHGWDSLAEATLVRALEWYRSLASRDARLEMHRYGFARSLYVAGEYREARSLFEGLFREHPDSLGYHGYLGSVAARMGNRDEALSISESLGDHARPYHFGAIPFWRARIASVLGDREGAMDYLRAAETEGYRFSTEERFIVDLAPMQEYPPFVEWLRPRG